MTFCLYLKIVINDLFLSHRHDLFIAFTSYKKRNIQVGRNARGEFRRLLDEVRDRNIQYL